MLKVLVIVKEVDTNDQKYWDETFQDVWDGPVSISIQAVSSGDFNADLIILDLSKFENEASDFMSSVSQKLYGKCFLITSKEKDIDLALKAINIGAVGFLVMPIKRAELLSCLDRLHSVLKEKDQEVSAPKAKVITLTSYKGGTGVSTTAVNMSYILASVFKKKTLIIDVCGYANHTATLLNIIPKFNLPEMCKQGANLDIEYFKVAVKTQFNNLGLVGGLVKTGVHDINSFTLKQVIEAILPLYDYIVVDTSGRVLDEMNMFFIRAANHLLLFTTIELMSIKDFKFFVKILQELGMPEGRIRPIVNRQDLYKGNIEPEVIQQQINKSIFHALPNDWETCIRATNEGKPIIETAPGSKLANSYKILAEKILQLDSPEVIVSSEDEIKDKEKGLLGWFKK